MNDSTSEYVLTFDALTESVQNNTEANTLDALFFVTLKITDLIPIHPFL